MSLASRQLKQLVLEVLTFTDDLQDAANGLARPVIRTAFPVRHQRGRNKLRELIRDSAEFGIATLDQKKQFEAGGEILQEALKWVKSADYVPEEGTAILGERYGEEELTLTEQMLEALRHFAADRKYYHNEYPDEVLDAFDALLDNKSLPDNA